VRDIAVILMFYDFFYYLVHRFLFHDEGFLGGPLMWVHAVHHRQHNPCRGDSSFIHPLEVALSTKYEAIEAYANSADVREGRRAYVEKRQPRWTGR
jgi:sterol desaturase/sphingolipid hydroxylase (fatty acid hydroxylase superfamily)